MAHRKPDEVFPGIENRLQILRTGKSLTQGELARMAGLTRQAVHAIETGKYFPATPVALRLAKALVCQVEDIFALTSGGEMVEGDLVGSAPSDRARVKVTKIGGRTIVRPLAELEDIFRLTVPADGLLLGKVPGNHRTRVRVELLRDRAFIDDEIIVAGCDPSILLVGEYVRRRSPVSSVSGWTMGSAASLEALRRGTVHVAGLHIQDQKSGEWNLPYLRWHGFSNKLTVVTFARWEAGLMVAPGNPKRIRDIGDLRRRGVNIVNREAGSGARELIDRRLRKIGVIPDEVKGYGRVVRSHLNVARRIADGIADAGIGLRSVATLYDLTFIPLQEERYDLVFPTMLLDQHRTLSMFLDTIVSRSFRTEIESLGGYDMRETGTVREV